MCAMSLQSRIQNLAPYITKLWQMKICVACKVTKKWIWIQIGSDPHHFAGSASRAADPYLANPDRYQFQAYEKS
jgi:hypothetical protein